MRTNSTGGTRDPSMLVLLCVWLFSVIVDTSIVCLFWKCQRKLRSANHPGNWSARIVNLQTNVWTECFEELVSSAGRIARYFYMVLIKRILASLKSHLIKILKFVCSDASFIQKSTNNDDYFPNLKDIVTTEDQKQTENDRKEATPRSLLRQFLKVNFPFILTIEKNHDFGINLKRVVSLPQKLPDLRIPFRDSAFYLLLKTRYDVILTA